MTLSMAASVRWWQAADGHGDGSSWLAVRALIELTGGGTWQHFCFSKQNKSLSIPTFIFQRLFFCFVFFVCSLFFFFFFLFLSRRVATIPNRRRPPQVANTATRACTTHVRTTFPSLSPPLSLSLITLLIHTRTHTSTDRQTGRSSPPLRTLPVALCPSAALLPSSAPSSQRMGACTLCALIKGNSKIHISSQSMFVHAFAPCLI